MDRIYKFHAIGQKAMEQFNKAMEEEASKWVTVEKPEGTGPSTPLLDEVMKWDSHLGDNRPRVYIHDEMGQMNFSKEETAALWKKIPKLNNGDKID